jgi:hypothetical protein
VIPGSTCPKSSAYRVASTSFSTAAPTPRLKFESISYGVIKMNDTDTQWAYWNGIHEFYLKNEGYRRVRSATQGGDKPNKKFYDPRVWLHVPPKSAWWIVSRKPMPTWIAEHPVKPSASSRSAKPGGSDHPALSAVRSSIRSAWIIPGVSAFAEGPTKTSANAAPILPKRKADRRLPRPSTASRSGFPANAHPASGHCPVSW